MCRIRSKSWTILLCLGIAAYLGYEAGFGRFVQMDEVFFKAAGREWARSGRFAAPEIDGVPTADPPGFLMMQPPLSEIWFAQLPGYTFLFGVVARIFGFGPPTCVMYDAVIHACLTALTFLIAFRLGGKPFEALAVIAGLAVLPLGTLARPDELAMCFGMAGIWLLLQPFPGLPAFALSGCLFGLCAATSAGAVVLLGMIALPFLASASTTLRRKVALIAIWSSCAIVIFAASLAPILVTHPEALHQFTAHASGHFWHGRYYQAFLKTWNFGKPYLALISAGMLVAAATLPASGDAIIPWLKLWLGPIAGAVFLAVFLPDKYLYIWFLGPWIIAAAALSVPQLAKARPPWLLRPLALTGACGYMMAAAPFLQGVINMVTLPRTQTLQANAPVVCALIPPHSTVVTDDYWWVLGDRCRIRDPYFSRPEPSTIDFIILGGDGTGDPERLRDLPPELAHYAAENFHCLLNGINGEPVRFFGRTLGHTGQGFGVCVLGREAPSSQSSTLAQHDRTH